jgi:hypothetical protein
MGGRTRRLVVGVVTSAAVLVGTVCVAGTGAAGAAGVPDVALSLAAVSPNPTAGQPFTVTYTLTNVGDADATSTTMDIILNTGFDMTWKSVNTPLGCVHFQESHAFAENGMKCPGGPVAAGQSVNRTFTFTSSAAGTFRRDAFAYSNINGPETNHDNDGIFYTVVVGPAIGGGGGSGNALQALLAALLALLHL